MGIDGLCMDIVNLTFFPGNDNPDKRSKASEAGSDPGAQRTLNL